ncbi:Bifunctional bis(5'-adenosyl)-triphosphatase/adenylylsulfatase FHIT [Cocos nucifera]|uniref:Bifunctional bis(5'-adenosyl)-triphosphatase/adenylylsulfatase FHIT n=1 Tax=Cocos nucifera TaxID=13894 RepID=A0A8K0IS50_COCNU|nr:Bifunctional bis(5'-adenosyl)-triphosphatase/adenylylsulfatase FHIT [Cocos nucifera]
MEAETTTYTFGPYKIDRSYVFYSTPLSFAMVNLRPVLPDSAIIRYLGYGSECYTMMKTCSIRRQPDFVPTGLALEEGPSVLEDGPQAGQTVPHVHIHILPRKSGDFENNDEIYDAINEKEKELKEKLDLDKERKDGTSEEMAREADIYHALFS